jgi:hypothetical protein
MSGFDRAKMPPLRGLRLNQQRFLLVLQVGFVGALRFGA